LVFVLYSFKSIGSVSFLYKYLNTDLFMARSSILIDIEDPRAGKIAEAIGNKTSKKILSALAEKEMNESEIAGKLGLPMNTVNYNVKKLVESGLIEKKRFLWSMRGKKVNYYILSNKRIVISPKKMISGIVPAALISGTIALFIRHFGIINSRKYLTDEVASGTVEAMKVAGDVSVDSTSGLYTLFSNAPNSWAWFLIGALAGLLIYLLWDYFRR